MAHELSKKKIEEMARRQLNKQVVFRTKDRNFVLAQVTDMWVVDTAGTVHGYDSRWYPIYALFVPSYAGTEREFTFVIGEDWFTTNSDMLFKDGPKWLRSIQYWLGKFADDYPYNFHRVFSFVSRWGIYWKILGVLNNRLGYHPYWPY